MSRSIWVGIVVFSCAVTVVTTAYAKFEAEIYPSVIFPSFGSPLDVDAIPPSAATSLLLEFGEENLEVSPRQWFVGPPESSLDALSDSFIDLPESNSDWMFERADELAGSCVERIEIVRPDQILNTFERSCS